MAWVWLLAAGLCEVVWALGLKKYGLRFTPGSIATILVMIVSFVLLERAMDALPVGTAYPVWTAIGAVGSAVFGMVLLGESRDLPRIGCIALIVAGSVGLKLLTPD